jgi:diacylglycerol kinase family enzyme
MAIAHEGRKGEGNDQACYVLRYSYAVINPGSGQPKPMLHTLNSVFRAAGTGWDVGLTRESGDGHRLAREALDAGAGVVVAFGGDGTVIRWRAREIAIDADPPQRVTGDGEG